MGKWQNLFLKELLKDIESKYNIKPVYISLYGTSNISEIDERIYCELHPILSSKPMRIASSLLRSAVKSTIKIELNDTIQIIGGLNSLDDLKSFGSHKNLLFIFDDFERSNIDHKEILGYTNTFVEHDNCRVVIAADETHISDDSDYAIVKEKQLDGPIVLPQSMS